MLSTRYKARVKNFTSLFFFFSYPKKFPNKFSYPVIKPVIRFNLCPLIGADQHFGSHLCKAHREYILHGVQLAETAELLSPVVPTGSCPGNDTALRSGSGRFRLGKLGSGGKPAGSGIRPTVKHRND